MPPEGLRFERYRPQPLLAPYVEHFWMVAGPVLSEVRSEILVPNGRPTILCCLGEPGARVDIATGERTVNTTSLTGLLTRPVILEQLGRSVYVAAQLTPWGLQAFAPGQHLVDEVMPLDAWAGGGSAGRLVAQMSVAELGEPAARMLEGFLADRLQPLPPPALAQVSAAVAAIEGEEGVVEVDAVAARAGLSYSTLYRLFKRYVGISPKQFIAISRYYRLVGGLLFGSSQGGLAQLALMQGYYDQAHATKDFRRFTGVSQGEFRRTLNGIAKLMHRGGI